MAVWAWHVALWRREGDEWTPMDVQEGGSFDDWAPGRTEESTFV